MNKYQKKTLYESIMRQVAKTVKKALNESLEQLDIDEFIELNYILFRTNNEFYRNFLKYFRSTGLRNRVLTDVDNIDDLLLAWYYEETPINYKELFKYYCSIYEHNPDDEILELYKNLYPELQKYPNTEYKEDLERCVRVGLQNALEDKGLI
jgi:5'-deoxynucleotidase YfbR-like HD superfamily hydrolase